MFLKFFDMINFRTEDSKMKKFFILAAFLVAAGLVYFIANKPSSKLKIGLVVPIEHQALKDISEGFKEEIGRQFKNTPYDLDILNAQGDKSLLKSIIDKLQRQNYDVVAAIGTEATLMAATVIKTKSLVGLDVTGEVNQQQKNITGILESKVAPCFEFLKLSLPDLKKVTVIYSASEKISKQIEDLIKIASEHQIELQPLMVQGLVDLYSISKFIDPRSNVIFILKDNVIVSGIPTLAKTAQDLKIPLFTCDEGSVISGAATGLGNKEKDIGVKGGEITGEILIRKKTPADIPLEPLQKFVVFLNLNAAQSQGLNVSHLKKAAQEKNYPIELVGKGEKNARS
jgi:putative ABC transport system substrate-binding protein